MALIDELASVIGADAVAKLKADPNVSKRITRGDDFYKMYVGVDDDTTTETPAATTTTTAATVPAVTTAPSNDNSGIMAELAKINSRLDAVKDLPQTIQTEVNKVVEARGRELRGGAVMDALRISDEMNRIYRSHEKTYGEDFDSTKFNTYVEEQKAAGRNFASVTQAYESFTEPKRIDKTVNDRVRDELKLKATNNVPGVTPPSSKSALSAIMNRGRATDNNNETAVDRAGRKLAERMAANAGAE